MYVCMYVRNIITDVMYVYVCMYVRNIITGDMIINEALLHSLFEKIMHALMYVSRYAWAHVYVTGGRTLVIEKPCLYASARAGNYLSRKTYDTCRLRFSGKKNNRHKMTCGSKNMNPHKPRKRN
jgi:hypothetical protein